MMRQGLRTKGVGPLTAILAASALSALSGAGIFLAHLHEPKISPLASVFIRVLVNGFVVMSPTIWGRPRPRLYSLRNGFELWVWALFGVLTIASFFYSVVEIGAGRATVCNAAGGLFLAALAPYMTKQSPEPMHILAAFGSSVGVWLMVGNLAIDRTIAWGSGLALASGLFAAIAYVALARTGARHPTRTVMWHWTVLNFLATGAAVLCFAPIFPHSIFTWMLLVGAGLAMAFGQLLTAIAYQTGVASLIACLSFSGPLLNVAIDSLIFQIPLSPRSAWGIVLVILCALIVPLARLSPYLESRQSGVR